MSMIRPVRHHPTNWHDPTLHWDPRDPSTAGTRAWCRPRRCRCPRHGQARHRRRSSSTGCDEMGAPHTVRPGHGCLWHHAGRADVACEDPAEPASERWPSSVRAPPPSFSPAAGAPVASARSVLVRLAGEHLAERLTTEDSEAVSVGGYLSTPRQAPAADHPIRFSVACPRYRSLQRGSGPEGLRGRPHRAARRSAPERLRPSRNRCLAQLSGAGRAPTVLAWRSASAKTASPRLGGSALSALDRSGFPGGESGRTQVRLARLVRPRPRRPPVSPTWDKLDIVNGDIPACSSTTRSLSRSSAQP
jgi:hypothetical protein